MAYSINGRVYTDHSLMDEVIYHTKLILDSVILKNESLADENETELSIEQSDYFLAVKNGSMELEFFPLTTDLLTQYGYSSLQAKIFVNDRSRIPVEDREDLLAYCNNWFLNHYDEPNNYYRMLNGLPEYGTDEYNIYIDPRNDKLVADDANTDFNFSLPLHEYSNGEINTLDSLGIIDDLLAEHDKDPHYRYLRYLGPKKIDVYEARIAANWDILYIPSVEYLVRSRFKEIYTVNRDIYFRRTYQEAYKFQSDYYDEIMMIMTLCQTLCDMIVDIPEWYIRRDVFDLRTVQYFLESQGVRFFKIIPLKYQIRIVKGMNKLIRYKSTTANINDILSIFGIEGTTVYKYFLFKKFIRTTHEQTIIIPDAPWSMDDEYDFGDEELFETVADTTDAEIYDFLDENEETFDPLLPLHEYNFGNEDASEAPDDEETDKKEDYEEENKIVIDEYGNIYDLEFVKVPINESYDDYIKDSIYRDRYDDITLADPYWDGEDVHYYVRNRILERDFTIEGTKYMSLDYKVSLAEYMYQMNYFLGMIFSLDTNLDDIKLSLPMVNPNTEFKLTDIFIFVYCLSGLYGFKTINIRTPNNIVTGPKPDYQNYSEFNGGRPWNGTDPYIPPTPEPEPEWEVDDIMDFGEEGVDNIITNALTTEMFDFGYQYDIDPTLPLHDYDFGEVEGDSYEQIIQIEPTPDGWVMGTIYDYASEDGDYYPPRKNFVGDAEDYEFADEATDTINFANPNLRYYDFLQEEIKYLDYVEPQAPAEEGDHYWDNLEKGSFTEDLDGGPVEINKKFRREINGGDKEYSKVEHETHYEWMRWNNPQLFVPTAGRIYGFNLSADMEELRRNVELRHSTFGFENGYTLEELGVDSFITTNRISSIDELINIYNNNTACYRALEERLVDINTRDDNVTFQYIFNTLFTKQFDFNFYRLKSGQLASTYDEILKEKNYALYRYYVDMTKEADLEVRKDNIRELLNEITSILEYYLKSDALQYIFEFIPTHSFESINRYIHLMIDFFKSWKVYFLDPTVTYEVDNKKDNKVGSGDMMTEIKIKSWYTDPANIADRVRVTPVYHFIEDNAGMRKEVIDMYAYHVSDVNDDIEFDGGYANASSLLRASYDALDGGGVECLSCCPFVMVNAGNVAARKEVYDIDGGGVLTAQEYLDIDGLKCNDYYSFYPIMNNYEVESYPVDGGSVTSSVHYNSSIITTVEKQVIRNDLRISTYRFNDLVLEEDGIYMDGSLAPIEQFEAIKRQIDADRVNYTEELEGYIQTVKIYNDPELMAQTIDATFESYFSISEAVIRDLNTSATRRYCISYVDAKIADLREWFLELDPFGWEYF